MRVARAPRQVGSCGWRSGCHRFAHAVLVDSIEGVWARLCIPHAGVIGTVVFRPGEHPSYVVEADRA